VGDVVVLENRDLFDHVISITGPQPMPDVILDRGTVAVVGPVLTPGTYRVESRSNLINATFTVEFSFACTVHASEKPQPAGRYGAIGIGLTLVGGFTLAALVAAVVLVLRQRAQKRNETNDNM
jgi:protein involved in polysaccharide export with SLBB domain